MRYKVARTLKESRKKCNFTPEYVVAQLKSKGFDIAEKTLYGYEAGRNRVNADIFLCLCKIYGITDFGIFFDEESDGLSQEDEKLLTAYHAHPEMQPAVNKMLDVENSKTIKKAVEETFVDQINNAIKNSTSHV